MAAVGFVLPRIIYHGIGTLEKLKEISGKKAFIVTGGSSMKKSGTIKRVQDYLQENKIESFVFDGVEADPSIETVLRGTEEMKKFEPDWIIGLGGCSAIDAGKAMWVFYEYPGTTLEDILPAFTIKPLRQKAKFIAIPSTSGTGTEVTGFSVITDRKKGVKYPLVSYEITPDIAIVDGEICKSMPPHITANTGMDALVHSTEAYVSTAADIYTDPIAKQSIELIFKNLPLAQKEPNNLEARQAMHDASCLAGIAFTNALLGIVHAMAHQVGGMFGVTHGCANAIIVANSVRFNQKATKRYEDLAKLLGKNTAEDFAVALENLRSEVGVPSSFKECGIEEAKWNEKLDDITRNALADACMAANPRTPTAEEVKRIFQYCYEGKKVDF